MPSSYCLNSCSTAVHSAASAIVAAAAAAVVVVATTIYTHRVDLVVVLGEYPVITHQLKPGTPLQKSVFVDQGPELPVEMPASVIAAPTALLSDDSFTSSHGRKAYLSPETFATPMILLED